jgi:hypothetical protein
LNNPTYYSYECPYCNKRNCKTCPLPYSDDMTVGKLNDKVKSFRDSESVDLEIFFQKNPEKAQQILDNIERINSGSSNITIEDCFKLFEQPETLEENN